MNQPRRRRAAWLSAAALVLVALNFFGNAQPGAALGQVFAITPPEVIPQGFVGYVFNPSLSGRGETAAVFDQEMNDNGFVFLDTPGQEPMVNGLGITVSGNGCVALWARAQSFVIGFASPRLAQQLPTEFGITDRCRGIERVITTTGNSYSSQSKLAISHDGRFAAIVIQGSPNTLVRVDTETLAQVALPPPDGYNGWYGPGGVDISDDGNVIVATTGFFIDGSGSLDVAAWDVGAGAVGIVSGQGTGVSAAFPSISGNGRYVSFAASKALVGGLSGNGPWVYVTDRANGSFRLISPAGSPAYWTSLTRDGSQVAYSVGPNGCQYDTTFFDGIEDTCPGTRVDVAYSPTPGFTTAPQYETVSLDANNRVAGRHFEPALSGNGRYVAWISYEGNNLLPSGDAVYKGNRQAFFRARDRALVVDNLDLGTISAGASTTALATVRNTGRTSVSLDSVTVAPSRFAVVGGGNCVVGSLLPPGATCTLNIRFTAPGTAGDTTGTLTVGEAGYDPISAVGNLIGRSVVGTVPDTTTTTTTRPPVGGTTTTTTSTTTTVPGNVLLTVTPNPVDFGQVPIGLGSAIHTVTVTNNGNIGKQLSTELAGDFPGDFYVVTNGCSEVVLGPGQSCTMDIMMIALGGGIRTAILTVSIEDGSEDVLLTGEGHFDPRLIASPAAITQRGITTIIGQGFPPGGAFNVQIGTVEVVPVVADAAGMFRVPVSAFGKLDLGNYVLQVDAVPNVFEVVKAQLVVVLPTFEPQGPGGPVFGNALIVTRGG